MDIKLKIKKLFNTSPSLVDDSKIEFKVEAPQLTREELFDDAVKQVIRSKVREAIKEQLIDMCYSDEVVTQTRAAIVESNKSGATMEEIAKTFPKAVIYRNSFWSEFRLTFDLDALLRKLVEDFDGAE